VVLDLEVEVAHPPGDEVQRTRGDIHGMDGGITYPVDLVCTSIREFIDLELINTE
jgi:hypothetical protein